MQKRHSTIYKNRQIVFIGIVVLVCFLAFYVIGQNYGQSDDKATYPLQHDLGNSLVPVSEWCSNWSGSSTEWPRDAIINGGNVYIAGTTLDQFTSQLLVFLAKYGPTGNILWNITWGTTDIDGMAIAVLGSYVYLAGIEYINYTSFIAKFNAANGAYVTSVLCIDSSTNCILSDITTYGTHLYVIGTSMGADCAYLARYDTNLACIWYRHWELSGSGSESGDAI